MLFKDSQVCLKALCFLCFTSEIIMLCLKKVMEMSGVNDVHLVQVTGHQRVDELAR